MLEAHSMSSADTDLAGRLAITLADLPGVQGAVVCSLRGDVLGDAGVREATKVAAVATFVACRAAALSLRGDLRGMGRLLANSRIDHVGIQSDSGDALILAPGSCYVSLSLQRGFPADVVASSAGLLLRRYL
jgi:hypothetical protein